MTTVGNLIQERTHLIMRKRVWEEIKDHLSLYTSRGEEEPAAKKLTTELGPVTEEVVLDVLAEIDADCVGVIEERIHAIDRSEVGGGKTKPKESQRKKTK